MKKILVTLFLLVSMAIPATANDENKVILPSETGLVESIKYEDVQGLNQGEETTKQIVTVKILTGKFKGAERIIDNMLTGNPSYDINLSKGDKVILHLEPLNDTVSTPDDVDIFIADIQRDNSIYVFTGLFFTLLLFIGKKKGATSIVSIVSTLGLIFFLLIPMILHGFCPIASAVLIGIFSVLMFAAGEILARPLSEIFVGYDAELTAMSVHAVSATRTRSAPWHAAVLCSSRRWRPWRHALTTSS